jgi:hypothetical protein
MQATAHLHLVQAKNERSYTFTSHTSSWRAA